MNKKNRKKKGFTLVELIVVIAILGILAAIAIPRLAGFRSSADDAKIKSQASVLTSAAQMYAADSVGNALPTGTDVADVITTLNGKGYIKGSEFTATDYDYDHATGIFTPGTGTYK